MRVFRDRLCRCGRMDMTRQLGQAGQIGGRPGRQDQVDGTGTAVDFDVDAVAVQDRIAEVEFHCARGAYYLQLRWNVPGTRAFECSRACAQQLGTLLGIHMDTKTEVRDFLTSRRAKITPAEAGLTTYGTRLTERAAHR
jgi:hypothetical protein